MWSEKKQESKEKKQQNNPSFSGFNFSNKPNQAHHKEHYHKIPHHIIGNKP
jgi:hypothetical protein